MFCILFLRVNADHHHRKLRKEALYVRKCFQSASPRHVDVQQDQIVACLGQALHRFIGIRGIAELRSG